MLKKVPLSEATLPQLRAFASSHLGIDIHPNVNTEAARAKVSAAWQKDEIFLSEEQAPPKQEGAPPQPVTEAQQPPKRKMVRIHIQRMDEPGGDEPVQVGVNGTVMLVPRGKPVDVPKEYYEVLKNCIKHVYDELPDGRGINPIPREVPLYPFSVVAA